MLTTVQKMALRFCALAFGLLTMGYMLTPHACAADFTPTRIVVTVEGQGPNVVMIPASPLPPTSGTWRPQSCGRTIACT